MELHAPAEPLPTIPRTGLPGLGLAVSAGLHGSILLALVVIGVTSAQTDDPGTGVVVEMQWEGPEGVALAMTAPPQTDTQPAPVLPPVPDVPAVESPTPPAPPQDGAAEPVPADVPPLPEEAVEAVQPASAPDPQPEPKPVEEPVPKTASVPPAPARPTPPPRPVQQARPLPPAPAGQGFSMAAEGDSQAATTENTGLTDKLVAPRAIYRPASPPPYPPAAVREGREGDPVVLIDLDSQGQIRGLSIKKSSGYSDLDTAAMNSLRVWIFAPATRNGVPFAAALEMTVRFRLDEVPR